MKQHKSEKCSLTIECLFLLDSLPLREDEIICRLPRVEPITGQNLYVLEKSADDILGEHKDVIWVFPSLKSEPRVPDADQILGKYVDDILRLDSAGKGKYISALLSTAALVSDITPVMHSNYLIAIDALDNHAIRMLRTNRHGIARTADLRPATYYVFGVFATGKETCVWHVKTELEAGENYLRLDDHNRLL